MANLVTFIFVALLAASSGKVNNFVEKRAYDYDLYDRVLDPELCRTHLREMSAFEFYDASFRIPGGILKGNWFSLGQYEQCLAIDQPLEEGSVRGKYCLIQTTSLRIPILTGDSWPANVTWIEMKNDWSEENYKLLEQEQRQISALIGDFESSSGIGDIVNAIPFTLALCIPRSCAVEDVLRPLTQSQLIEFNYTEEYCRLPDDKPISGADIAAIVIFSIIGGLTLLSTAYELDHIFIKKSGTKPDELKSCFSVYGNTERLLTFGSKPGALDCLDGIRALSILWVIFGHTFLVYYLQYLSNIMDVAEFVSNLRSVIIMGANVSVDSFFVLSGLLLVYTTANKMKQMDLLKKLHLFYLNRLLRMFPLLAAMVLLQASLLNQVADGVRWNYVAWETQKCRDYWWSALLHIQNIVNPREICLSHSWYLSVDIQLHILSPLLLFWMLGSRRSAWTAITTAILGFLTFVTIYCVLMGFHQEIGHYRYAVYYYNNTLTRAPVFLIGMLCGYLLHIRRHKKIRMAPWMVCLGYVLAMVLAAYAMYQAHHDWEESKLGYNLNISFMRSGWAAALCWLVVVCVHGYAGPINWLLSIKLWKFIARISYAIYLFHYPMQYVMSGADSAPVYFSMESGFIYFASDVAYSIIVATAACVLIDEPFATLIRRLMKLILPSPPPAKKPVDETTQTQEDGPERKAERKSQL